MDWANPDEGGVDSSPAPLLALSSPWQPLRYWRGLQFKGLISATSGSFRPDSLSA